MIKLLLLSLSFQQSDTFGRAWRTWIHCATSSAKKAGHFQTASCMPRHSTRFKLIDLEQQEASEHVDSRRGKETKRRGLIRGLGYRVVNFSGDLHEENVFPALTVCTLSECVSGNLYLWMSLSTPQSLNMSDNNNKKNLNDFFVLNVSRDCTSLVQNTLCTAVVLACV